MGASPDDWVKVEFALTPTAGTQCVGIDVGSDPAVNCTQPTDELGHACVRCAGQFSLGLASAGRVDLDYVWLQPGAWGRVGDLPVRKQTAEVLAQMGIRTIRLGGSFASVTAWPDGGGGTPPSDVSGEYYQWQKWTGPPWLRPSVGAVWNAYSGDSYSLIGPFGPFEFLAMTMALGIEPILTTTSSSTPAELADLVEYCWGNASTPMGAKRAADGHAAPYTVKYFELGNEQHNEQFVAQVAAMEARARTLGLGGTLTYIFPSNDGLTADEVNAAKASGVAAGQIATDVHVGADGAIGKALDLFARYDAQGWAGAAINQETNAGTHNHARALAEAADLNAFFSANASVQNRLLGRTASFCTSRSGHFDAFDQGISFFLPNASWLQPPGHVHAMIAATAQPNALGVRLGGVGAGGGGAGVSASAQASDDGSTVAVRVVYPLSSPVGPPGVNTSVDLRVSLGAGGRCAKCSAKGLWAADASLANPSWAVDLVAPRELACGMGSDGRSAALDLPELSYVVVEFTGCA